MRPVLKKCVAHVWLEAGQWDKYNGKKQMQIVIKAARAASATTVWPARLVLFRFEAARH